MLPLCAVELRTAKQGNDLNRRSVFPAEWRYGVWHNCFQYYSLVALHKEPSLSSADQTAFPLFGRISDFSVGLFSEPLAVIYWMSVMYERWGI